MSDLLSLLFVCCRTLSDGNSSDEILETGTRKQLWPKLLWSFSLCSCCPLRISWVTTVSLLEKPEGYPALGNRSCEQGLERLEVLHYYLACKMNEISCDNRSFSINCETRNSGKATFAETHLVWLTFSLAFVLPDTTTWGGNIIYGFHVLCAKDVNKLR